jgi:peptide/nickel transport system ATP-binding protein
MDRDLVIEELSIHFGDRPVVHGLSLHLKPGKAVALVGESGSGKSVTARSLVGLAGHGARVHARQMRHGERDLLHLSAREWRALRGRDIGVVLQDALGSLDPLRTAGQEILEALTAHGWGDRRSRPARVIELLAAAGVPEPQLRARQRPGELSGGLRQRALIASALAMNPGLVIADEPTTALDVTLQAQILALLQGIKKDGRALLLISHDLSVVADLADDILVLQQGAVVEQGPAAAILTRPQHPYTRSLLQCLPAAHPRGTRLSRSEPAHASAAARTPRGAAGRQDLSQPLLEVRNIARRYRGPDHVWRQALADVSFSLAPGRTLGIVGESGSGKTTLARIVLGLLEPDAGSVQFLGKTWNGVPERQRRPLRRELGVIYQDPLGSFDPRWNVGQILEDALEDSLSRSGRQARVVELLQQVALPADIALQRPLLLSGGQRQRIAIARALATRPSLIVCDEPVSALDVQIQAQVLDLMADLQEQLGLAYLFISHDLGVIRHVSDDVLVLHRGQAVEHGPAERLFTASQHPYTQQLLAALPRPVPAGTQQALGQRS